MWLRPALERPQASSCLRPHCRAAVFQAKGFAGSRLRHFIFLSLLCVAAAEEKKKSKFLEPFPMIVKAGLFWWCIFVFVVVAYFIVEVLWVRYKGTAVVQWGLTFDFDGTATRKVYWEQFVEPSKWSQSHPVVQSAVISMVQNVLAENSGQREKDGEEAAKVTCETNPNEEQTSDPLLGLKVVPFGPMAVNRGLTLRVRNGDMEGSFFCARLCTEISTPDEGPWTYTMKTVSTGPAYPYLSGTETSTMKMWPEEGGKVHCEWEGRAEVASRFYRWWQGLDNAAHEGAKAVMEAINDEVRRSKKHD